MMKEFFSQEDKSTISPWHIMLKVVLTIVIAEALIMTLFTFFSLPYLDSFEYILIDTLLLAATASPFMYFFIILPLQKQTISDEKIHSILYDSLTTLPRRELFHEMVEHEINTAGREAYCVTLIIIDPTEFSGINQALGYQTGDEILHQIANRLKSTVRESDIVSRLSGDEFGILLPHADIEQTKIVEKKIRSSLDEPFKVGSVPISISSTMGISIFPDHADSADDLIKRANIARIKAKKEKRPCEVFDVQYESDPHQRLILFGQLREAIKQGKLELYYQPKIALESGSISGVEALVRWTGEDGQPPSVFIPLAEQTGLINDITKWVFKEGIRQCSEWYRQGLHIPVSMNISTRNLFNSDFNTFLIQQCEQESLPLKLITIEVTESAFMEHPEIAIESLLQLRDSGFKISIDDFGTGYSSLAYLKHFPATELKIDQSFIINILSDKKDETLVRSTIRLAKDFGLQVVIEGVETEEIMEKVQSCGGDIIQGYCFSAPLTADAFIEWNRQWSKKARP
ncbi:MAG: bifunctional diguanylate cyclase/phosphodiesterase [Mariprofundaceae bacterium]